jgi:hypothetical protein
VGVSVSQTVNFRETVIILNNGRSEKNETLTHYIEIAEREILKRHYKELIECARYLAADEIASIKELVK